MTSIGIFTSVSYIFRKLVDRAPLGYTCLSYMIVLVLQATNILFVFTWIPVSFLMTQDVLEITASLSKKQPTTHFYDPIVQLQDKKWFIRFDYSWFWRVACSSGLVRNLPKERMKV